MRILITIYFSLITLASTAQCDQNTVWNNTTTNAVCTEVDGAVRHWYANSLPDHVTGTFPGQGNPNAISAQEVYLTMCAYPLEAGQFTGLLINMFY